MLKNSICQELSIKVACFTSLLDKYVVLENCQNKVLQFPEKGNTFFLMLENYSSFQEIIIYYQIALFLDHHKNTMYSWELTKTSF